MALTLTIGGTPRTMRAGSLDVVEGLNGRSSLQAGVLSLDGSYQPDVGDTVLLEDGATTVFAGVIVDTDVAYLAMGSGTLTTITASDYSAYAERRVISASTSGGITGRDAIDYVVTNYLATYGVTRDPSMAAGATLGALSYDYATATEVLTDIVRLAAPTGWLWRIDEDKVLKAWLPGTAGYPCPFSVTTGALNIAGDLRIKPSREDYANRVILQYGDGTATPAVVTSDDSAEQTARGIYEVALSAPGPLDASTAQDLADAYLAQLVVSKKQVQFTTRTAGAHAGQTVTINVAARGLNNDFLITEVRMRDVDGVNLFYDITAIEGGTASTSWKDTYREWSGTSSAVTAVGGGVLVTSVVGRSTYFLGGSGIAGERSAGPSVVNAVGYIDVMLDTAALGASTSVTAVVQCKTSSGPAGVTPQVYNVTDATVAGTGTLATGTAWQTVTFTITLASGQKYYRLRMTPDTANVDCFTLGYLEVGR